MILTLLPEALLLLLVVVLFVQVVRKPGQDLAARWLPWACLGVLALGLLVRTISAAVLVGPGNAFTWLTPGAQIGFAIGCLVLAVTLPLPAVLRLMVAALALMAGTVLVNLAPPNPYSLAALAAWRQGHFLNFNGLTRVVAIFWPFLALPFFFVANRRSP